MMPSEVSTEFQMLTARVALLHPLLVINSQSKPLVLPKIEKDAKKNVP